MNPEVVYGIHPVISLLEETGFFPADEIFIQKNSTNPRLVNVLHKAKKSEVKIRYATYTEITRIAGNDSHQGIALRRTESLGMEPEDEEAAYAFAASENDVDFPRIFVALDKVTDPRNAGAVARSLGAFASAGLILGEKNAPPLGPTMLKTSAGVISRIRIFRVASIWKIAAYFRAQGIPVLGLDVRGENIKDVEKNLHSRILENGVLIIAGSEEKGLSREVRAQCSHLIRIPHTPLTESLNVSVAVSIALYEISREYFS